MVVATVASVVATVASCGGRGRKKKKNICRREKRIDGRS